MLHVYAQGGPDFTPSTYPRLKPFRPFFLFIYLFIYFFEC
jgi:hypothetical protein